MLSEFPQQFLAETEVGADIGGWHLDVLSGELVWSPRIYDIFGLPTETPLSVEYALSFFSPESRRKLASLLEAARKGASFHVELDFYDAQQRYKRVVATGRPLSNSDGNVAAVRGSFQNITNTYFERERNKLALAAADIGVWELLHDTGRLSWNEEMARLYHIQHAEPLVLSDWLHYIHEDDREGFLAQLTKQPSSERLFETTFRILVTNAENVRLIRCVGRHFFDSNNQVVRTIGVNMDITTEQLKQHDTLIQTTKDIQNSKFIALGEMAANIGHEINNPLAIIKGNLDILRLKLSPSLAQEIATPIDNINRCVERMQNLTNGLRRLVRDDALEGYQPVDVAEVLRTTVSLLREIYHKGGVSLSLHCHRSFWVLGHFSELQQVFLNLLSNARDAVEATPRKDISVSITQQGKEIVVAVKDTGIGIKEALQGRIFDSLFTQKPAGKGTGLGLSLCRRIVSEHKGNIQVYSSPGEGATFTVRLPVFTQENSEARSTPSARSQAPQTDTPQMLTATVLVVDDEPLILEVVAAYLAAHDVETICCQTTSAATHALAQHHFDAVITDLNMPNVEGDDFLHTIKRLKPNLPIILMTGSVLETRAMALQDDWVAERLYKPFSEDALIRALSGVLRGK